MVGVCIGEDEDGKADVGRGKEGREVGMRKVTEKLERQGGQDRNDAEGEKMLEVSVERE